MTTLQVKQQIDAMSDDDRFLAAAYLEHLSNERDAAYRYELGERMKRMDAGNKVSMEQLERLHHTLECEGM
jgi:hypothetical protein